MDDLNLNHAQGAETMPDAQGAPLNAQEEVLRLAMLDALHYGQARKDAAKRLNMTCTHLDRAVKEAKARLAAQAIEEEQRLAQEAYLAREAALQAEREARQAEGEPEQEAEPTRAQYKGIPLFTGDGKPRKQSDVMIDIGHRHHRLFHDESGDAYAGIAGADSEAVMALEGIEYRERLGYEYHQLSSKGANRNAIADAICTLTATAKYEGPCEPVWLRTAKIPDGIAIDCGDTARHIFYVTADGWHIANRAPVNLRRAGKTTVLPMPVLDGLSYRADIAPLWQMVNVRPRDRVLYLAWLLGALRPSGPYPVLIISGGEGTAKTTASEVAKKLTDMSATLLRSPPKDVSDLQVAARHSWVVALDNLSSLNAEMSDALCRLATGCAMATRTLYTTSDETSLELARPVILNGISDCASRPDLVSRSIRLELPLIADNVRRTEADIKATFAKQSPLVMAALLDGIAHGLRHIDEVRCTELPRMADFAKWAMACLPALGYSASEFLTAFNENQTASLCDALDDSPIAQAVLAVMRDRTEPLKLKARAMFIELQSKQNDLPAMTDKALHNALRRIARALNIVHGIVYEKERDHLAKYVVLRRR